MPKLKLGNIFVDALSFNQAICKIESLIRNKVSAIVFTPNSDHIVRSKTDEEFKRAYDKASICLPDGMPLVWASKLFKVKFKNRIAGADLLNPLLSMSERNNYKVYFLGSSLKNCELAAQKAKILFPRLTICGLHSPLVSNNPTDQEILDITNHLNQAAPDLIIVAFGSPKQEIFISKAINMLDKPSVMMGLGALLDFLSGSIKRAPDWMRGCGLEWLYRLYKEPKRLWRRYMRSLKFFSIVANQLVNKNEI